MGSSLGVLGPTVVSDDTGPIGLPRARERAVLAALALHHPAPVPAAGLADLIWGSSAPQAAAQTVRSHVSRVRAAVGPDLITSGAAGYALRLPAEAIDVRRFEGLVADAVIALRTGDADLARRSARAALALWRGEPFADLDGDIVAAERARLAQQRRRALICLGDALSRQGRHDEAVELLEPECAAQPLDEELWAWLVRCLHGSGRRQEALARFDEVRAALATELGLDPGALLQLTRDEALRGADPSTASPPVPMYAQRDGRSIAYVTLGVAGPPLLLLHGMLLPATALFEEPSAARFLARLGEGRRLLVMDLGGLGLSDPVAAEAMSVAGWAADVEAVLDAAGVRRVPVIGLSAGAAVAMSLADRTPQRIERLVLTSLPIGDPGLPTTPLEDALAQVDRGPGWKGGAVAFLAPSRSGDRRFVQWLDRNGERGASPSTARAFLRTMYRTDISPVAARVAVPVLVIERDAAVGAGEPTRRFVELLPDARHVILPGTDVLPFCGDADAWLDAALAFLDQPSSAAAARLAAVAATRSSTGTIVVTAHETPHQAEKAARSRMEECGGAGVLHVGLVTGGSPPAGPGVTVARDRLVSLPGGALHTSEAFTAVQSG